MKKIAVKTLQKTPDGMGGFIEAPFTVMTFYGKTAPLSVDIQLQQYGFLTNQGLKILTNAKLPDLNKFRLEIDGKLYKVMQRMENEKATVLLVEVMK